MQEPDSSDYEQRLIFSPPTEGFQTPALSWHGSNKTKVMSSTLVQSLYKPLT